MAYIKDPKERLFNERFVLQNPIGKGGYSKVYKAHCIRNAKTVAVKRVKRSMVESYDLVEDEFIPTELNILRKLQKIKYVIKIQECIESDNFVYFILEKPTNYQKVVKWKGIFVKFYPIVLQQVCYFSKIVDEYT